MVFTVPFLKRRMATLNISTGEFGERDWRLIVRLWPRFQWQWHAVR